MRGVLEYPELSEHARLGRTSGEQVLFREEYASAPGDWPQLTPPGTVVREARFGISPGESFEGFIEVFIKLFKEAGS